MLRFRFYAIRTQVADEAEVAGEASINKGKQAEALLSTSVTKPAADIEMHELSHTLPEPSTSNATFATGEDHVSSTNAEVSNKQTATSNQDPETTNGVSEQESYERDLEEKWKEDEFPTFQKNHIPYLLAVVIMRVLKYKHASPLQSQFRRFIVSVTIIYLIFTWINEDSLSR